jgi:iron complex outermembrane receptor protein
MQLPLSKDATKVRGAAMPRLGLVKLSAFVLLTSFVSVLVAEKSLCEEAEQMHSSGTGVEKSSQLLSKTKRQGTTKKIRQLSEIERPSTSAQMLLGQSPAPQTAPSAEVVQVTEVKANPTDKGVEIILQTTKGQALQLVNRSTGNTFIAEIPNAQLRLPSGERFTFRSEKPIGGVTEITVTNFDAKTIRVTVKGEAGVPIVELFDSPNEGLIFSVASTAQRAQQGQNPTPNSSPNLAEGQAEGSQQQQNQTQLTQPSASGDEPIELVVTGQQDGYLIPDASIAKTDTPILNTPRSIQVIPQQVLEDQKVVELQDALRNV